MNEALLTIERMGPLGSFPWHTQQEFGLASATNVVVVLGGNQSGKTTVGAGIISRLVRREGPIYRRLRKPDDRPLRIWVSPQSFEKYSSNWERRLRDEVFAGMKATHRVDVGYKQSPTPVFTWNDDGAEGNQLWGKCLPLTEPVLMADGSTLPLSAVTVGSWVLGGDGQPAEVVGASRSGRKMVWRLTLENGRTVRLTDNHVLPVTRGKGKPVHELTLQQIRDTMASDTGRGWKVSVPRERNYLVDDVLPIPPYTLGVLLGDGHLSDDGVTFYSADPEVVERLREDIAPLGYALTRLQHPYGYYLKGRRAGRVAGRLTAGLRELGLMGRRSADKFVPDVYLRASHADRVALVEGLIDSDGTQHTYTSCSPALARGFGDLVESIGGRANRLRERTTFATNASGHTGTQSFRLNWLRHGLDILPRKAAGSRYEYDTTLRRIASMEMVGEEEVGDISVDNANRWFVAGDAQVIVHNSQDQGFLAFESDKVDLIVFDEEPKDPRVYTSAVQRLATTNGIIVLTFTPLMGMSWTHARLYHPTVRKEYKVAERVWRRGNDVTVIEMGMADNPESVAGGGVARIQNDPGITEAEKNTRLHGQYGYAEGLVFPEFATLSAADPDNPYLLDGLPEGRPYSWLLTCDPNKRHGGLLTAIDHEGNRYYVAEHYKEDQPDRLHAKDYHELLARFGLESDGNLLPSVGVYADPGGAGAQAIVNLSDYKIYAQAVKKDAGSVKASIELVRRAAWIDPTHGHPVKTDPDGEPLKGAPHVYFLRSLRSTWRVGGVEYIESRLMWELRQYRQKDNSPPDTPIKELDDVTDCARYVELVRPFSPIAVDRSAQDARAKLDTTSRHASEEFDELVKKGKGPKERRIAW